MRNNVALIPKTDAFRDWFTVNFKEFEDVGSFLNDTRINKLSLHEMSSMRIFCGHWGKINSYKFIMSYYLIFVIC